MAIGRPQTDMGFYSFYQLMVVLAFDARASDTVFEADKRFSSMIEAL